MLCGSISDLSVASRKAKRAGEAATFSPEMRISPPYSSGKKKVEVAAEASVIYEMGMLWLALVLLRFAAAHFEYMRGVRLLTSQEMSIVSFAQISSIFMSAGM